MSDSDIMRDVQAGRLERFEELAGRYRSRLCRAALSALPDAASADDAVQETLLAAFASRDTFSHRFAFSTWIWTIFLNVCRRSVQRQARERRLLIEAAGWQRESHCPHVDAFTGLDRLLAEERREELRQLLEQLPDVEADTLRLRFFGDLKFEEISQVMECSLGAAKTRTKRGLLRLADLWRARQADPPVTADVDLRGTRP